MSERRGEVEVVTMRSGLAGLLDHEVGEVMHPVVGPLLEAQQSYVGPSRLAQRLVEASPLPLTLFDVGLGAGSNAGAAWRLALSLPEPVRALRLVSFERELAAFRLAAQPEHAPSFGLDGVVASAGRDLLAHGEHVSGKHSWRLVLGELPGSLSDSAEPADIVFWDPFSPKANPELWSLKAFSALHGCCGPQVTVHTYSGATAVRAALLLAGFYVGFGDPSSDKGQHTTAALQKDDLLRPLDQRWLERLLRSSAPLPADAPPDALSQIERHPQF